MRNHPIATAGLVGSAAAVLLVVALRSSPPAPVFKDESNGVRFKSDAEFPSQIGGLVTALRELHAEGLFREQEGRVLTREFVDLARAGASQDAEGQPVLSRVACRALFQRIGIRSERVSDSLFDSFDEDHSGTISLKEFLHALILVMRGTASEKLERVFDCIDLDHDGEHPYGRACRFWLHLYFAHAILPCTGLISEAEMVEFFRSVMVSVNLCRPCVNAPHCQYPCRTMYSFSGKPKPLAAVQAHVLAMFRATRCQTHGFLSRDGEKRDLGAQYATVSVYVTFSLSRVPRTHFDHKVSPRRNSWGVLRSND